MLKITNKDIELFLLEAQSHSGLPLHNKYIKRAVNILNILSRYTIHNKEFIMSNLLNEYMITVHNNRPHYDF